MIPGAARRSSSTPSRTECRSRLCGAGLPEMHGRHARWSRLATAGGQPRRCRSGSFARQTAGGPRLPLGRVKGRRPAIRPRPSVARRTAMETRRPLYLQRLDAFGRVIVGDAAAALDAEPAGARRTLADRRMARRRRGVARSALSEASVRSVDVEARHIEEGPSVQPRRACSQSPRTHRCRDPRGRSRRSRRARRPPAATRRGRDSRRSPEHPSSPPPAAGSGLGWCRR